ncbi:hypothetical protein D3C87_1346880 [compost metagenome]
MEPGFHQDDLHGFRPESRRDLHALRILPEVAVPPILPLAEAGRKLVGTVLQRLVDRPLLGFDQAISAQPAGPVDSALGAPEHHLRVQVPAVEQEPIGIQPCRQHLVQHLPQDLVLGDAGIRLPVPQAKQDHPRSVRPGQGYQILGVHRTVSRAVVQHLGEGQYFTRRMPCDRIVGDERG